jgi:hypothetical protein
MLGAGLAGTAVSSPDGLTWLGDDPRGEVVQVNPATGQPGVRLKVAPAGDELVVAQLDGLLVVTDATTGAVTVIDIATLVAGGKWVGTGAGAVEVLLGPAGLFVVDRVDGAVQRIDPATAADLGPRWFAGGQLADAALDRAGVIWVLRADGRLFSLVWSAAAGRLVEQGTSRQVEVAGARSVLVGHARGVTVVALEGRSVVRVGTGRDAVLPAPQLTDPVRAAAEAPVDLVPVALPPSRTLLIVREHEVLAVPLAGMDCQPGTPVVFQRRIYVPCLGAGRVLAFDADGRRRLPDLTVAGGGDPELVLDDGRLVIHVPGGETGFVIQPDGSAVAITTHDESVTAQEPSQKPPVSLPPPGRPDPGQGQGQPPPGGAGATQPPGAPPTTGPPPATAGPPQAPVNIAAQARADGTVLVTWQPQGTPDEYRVHRADTSAVVATVGGSATSATVTTLPLGVTVTLWVEAVHGGQSVNSAPSNQVSAYTIPDAPTAISVSWGVIDNGYLEFQVDWTAGADNGRPVTRHRIITRTNRGYVLDWGEVGGSGFGNSIWCSGQPCDGLHMDVEIRAVNVGGAGPAGTGGRTFTLPYSVPHQMSGSYKDTRWQEGYDNVVGYARYARTQILQAGVDCINWFEDIRYYYFDGTFHYFGWEVRAVCKY